jgi:hypothetical protein
MKFTWAILHFLFAATLRGTIFVYSIIDDHYFTPPRSSSPTPPRRARQPTNQRPNEPTNQPTNQPTNPLPIASRFVLPISR